MYDIIKKIICSKEEMIIVKAFFNRSNRKCHEKKEKVIL